MRSNRSRLAALCALLLLPAAAAREARAQGSAPAGSYQQTCKVSSWAFGHMVVASCRNKGGGTVSTRLRYAFLCEGDIWNNDGRLGCNKSAASPRFKSAAAAFNSAAPVVLGRAPKGTDIHEGSGDPAKDPDSELLQWLALMHAEGMGQTYQDGTRFSDAVAVLKTLAAQQPKVAGEVVSAALKEVYGASDQTKFETWVPQVRERKAWFATIVSAERQNKKKN